MGRKSREKRERGATRPDAEPTVQPEASAVAPAAIELSSVRQSRVRRDARQRRKPRPVGARVARVAVDDATWEAFKELCGPTPASIRLGQLVTAEVERARRPASETDALAAVEAIRAHLVELETLARSKSKQ